MQTDNRKRLDAQIAAHYAFRRRSDALIEQLRAAKITIAEYEARLAEAQETLDETLEALQRTRA
jgi:hypothetical protein